MKRIVEALVEIPMGCRNKYEVDHESGKIKLDRVLYSASHYPAEYGFLENTLSTDGDPLDILIFTSSPTFPGCYIDVKIIGGLDMIDNGDSDVKILSVNAGDPRYSHIETLEDLAPHYLREIENFFSTYKTLQVDKETQVLGYFDADTAMKYYEEAKKRFEEHK